MSRENKILVVDDDLDLLQALGIRLISAGYDIVVAADENKAIHAALTSQPDLILLDLGLHDGDGMNVLSCLNGIVATAAVPIIVITARDASWERKVLMAGATAFFQKPVNQAELLATIALALEESEAMLQH